MSDTKITTLDDETTATAAEQAPQATKPARASKKAEAADAKSDAAAENEAPVAVDAEGLSGRKCVVTIHADKGDGGNLPVFLGINGRGYQLPRGVPCTVPVELVGVLENAVETVYDGGGAGREVPRYAFSVKSAE